MVPAGQRVPHRKYTRAPETSTDEPDAGGGRLAAAAGYPDQRTHTDRDWAVLGAVRDAATTCGCSPAQVALAWTLHQPAVAATLIGATSTEQLHANLAAAALSLPPDVLHALGGSQPPARGLAVPAVLRGDRLNAGRPTANSASVHGRG